MVAVRLNGNSQRRQASTSQLSSPGSDTFSLRNIKASKKDLVSLFPEIATEWDYEKNSDLDPTALSPGSNIKVWWVCAKGHSYQAWMHYEKSNHLCSNNRFNWRTYRFDYCRGKTGQS